MKDGKVESTREAIALMFAHVNCHGQDCDTCPMNRGANGEEGKGRCSDNKERVQKFFEETFGAAHFLDANDPALDAYDFIMNMDLGKAKKEKPKEEPKSGTCETCFHSAMHPSGILFCKSFHNFVHENGFCYRYVDGKMDEETACG